MTTVVDYTSRDFDSLKQSLLDYAAQNFSSWTPSSEGDFGTLMLELLAYVGDVTSYYIDRAQNEAYLPSASQASSVLQIAQLLGYTPGTGQPATGTVTFVANALTSTSATPAITIPAGTQVATDYVAAVDGPVIFETDSDAVVVVGNSVTVNVTEGQTWSGEQVGVSSGLPAQEYQIKRPRVYVDSVEVTVAGATWREVAHLLDADPDDQVFETYNDNKGYTWVRFGDGLNGAVPSIGLNIDVTYRTGYGAAGNVAAGAVVTMVSKTPSGVSVQKSSSTSGLSTSSAMTGGADPESIDSIRDNAPKTFFSQQRAVTLQDFINFATGVPGVAKANAVADYFSSVTIYVVGPDGGAPTQALLDSVASTVQSKALAGVSVQVGAPTSVPVNVGATGSEVAIEVWHNYSRSEVQYAVEQAIKARLSFTNVGLGDKITVADLYQVVMNVDGVRYADIPLMARSDSAQSGTADIQFQAWEYPTPGNVIVTSTGGIG